MAKIALLSNVNLDMIAKTISKENEVYTPDGYGSVVEELINPMSGLNIFAPTYCFIIMDVEQLAKSMDAIEAFLVQIEPNLKFETTYFISDASFRTDYHNISANSNNSFKISSRWNKKLSDMISDYKNVMLFPYNSLVEAIGKENFYSSKMWYMGRIIHTKNARKLVSDEITRIVRLHDKTNQKKVLVLDLDNTLWGGICGEGEVELSEERTGLIYKELQQVIKRMQEVGVILAIASKNNPNDALDVINNNTQMVLKEEDFAVMRINWDNKPDNVSSMVKELNVGLDSVVFFDDNPMERDLMKSQCPEVTVPDFPDSIENLPDTMQQIYHDYFEKANYTAEDKVKTKQYRENAIRNELQNNAGSFEEYLKQLQIQLREVSATDNIERVHHLIGKTNQFNLTTKRYSRDELFSMLESENYLFYVFDVKDKFGDNGITALAIVDVNDKPIIDSFIMSCRIMGRRIENTILSIIEQDVKKRGYNIIIGEYIPSVKNMPCKELYVTNGYTAMEKINPEEINQVFRFIKEI